MKVSSQTLRRVAAAFAGAVLALAVPAVASAQSTLRVELGAAGPTAQNLSIPRGKSAIIELPVDARDVLVSNPAVADAVLRTPRRIYVLGVAPGQTDAVFFDAAGRQILSLNIRVDQSTQALEDTIRRVAPTADVKIEAVNDGLILTGSVASARDAAAVEKIAARYVERPELITNLLSIRGGDQVMIKVQIVEMQRSVIKQLGVNAEVVANQLGDGQWILRNLASFPANGSFLGEFLGGYQYDDPSADGVTRGAALLQAFERVGLVRTLAEPNLTAISGESGKFLAGGEFPVPVGRDQDGNIIIEFKPYGVALGYTPVVLSEGRISVKIATEVSELTNEGSLQVTGLNIPGLSVRRAETTVELASGESLMIAGLLREQTKQNIDALPGMTGLPVLGALFRSRDYLAGETELVIIITPYIVSGTSPRRMQTPVDGLEIASDVETTLLGRLNRATRGETAPPPPPGYRGPVGYVIE